MSALLIADVTASLLLATLCFLAYLFVPGTQVPPMAWPFLYAMALGFCLFAWHLAKAPNNPMRWLSYAALSPLAAVAWYAVAIIAGRVFLGQPEPSGPTLFNLGIALAVAPGFTVIALLGSVRAMVLASW
jgi:hypothetical protein